MAIVTLAEAKAHLRIDFNEDDSLIEGKIDAAQAHLETLLGFKLDDVKFPDTDDADFPDTVPADLHQAVLLLLGHWYENREATGSNLFEVPMSVWDVVRERRSYAFE
ncbi:head-tail connector protein [Rhizobium leguminosarum]|uniref:head-tail connector protein n=1 Tax=Rhizobium leguminosarum TaxID=384 RepID=UPI001AE38BE8|nr:head-tail connector protein [Rhizobium leguminosarum]MBP2445946.1 putative phage protein (predicted DNA packaging) [Rhizobium leguminosarum]